MTINFLWILLGMGVYGFLHSLLASLPVKDRMEEKLGISSRRWYRLAFNIIAAITFLPVAALVVVLPDAPIYRLAFPRSLPGLLLQGLAVLGVMISVIQTGAGYFLGLKQLRAQPGDGPRAVLVTTGFYRYMRHPIYFFGLLFIWFTPWLTWNILALNLALTAYLWIGAILEEKRLVLEFGDSYLEYRQNVPMIIPRIGLRK